MTSMQTTANSFPGRRLIVNNQDNRGLVHFLHLVLSSYMFYIFYDYDMAITNIFCYCIIPKWHSIKV